jgi:hypothetical protein
MKKSLLNYKSLNYAFLLFLLCANSIYSQTVLTETFGTAANATYIGETSVPLLSYTQSGGGVASTAVIGTGTDAYLNLVTNAVAPAVGTRPTFCGTIPTGTGFNAILTSNTNVVTWTVNMKTNKLGSNSSSSYAEGKNFMCVVLCATNNGILGNTTPTGSDGYALMYQKSTADGTKASVSLIKFHNGIGNSSLTVDAQELCTATRLIESPALTAIPATASYAALSVKVVYNPNFDSWQLYYREDPATATDPIADPTTGTTLLLAGTVTDATYTSTAMTNFGFIAGSQTNNGNKSQFDNFKIGLSAPPPYTAPPTVEKRQVFNNTTNPTVANLVAIGTNIKWYDVSTGGTALATSTPLTYSNYYVTQTVSSTESERELSQVFIGDIELKTLPLYEGFANYTISDKLIVMNNSAAGNTATGNADGIGLGSWSLTPGTNITDDVTIVASPTWTNIVLPNAAGNAITFVGSGIDPELKFTNTTSGSLYSSFVFNAVDAPATIVASTTTDANYSIPTGFYSFMALSPSTVTPGTFSNDYAAAVMFRKNIASGKYNFGLSKSSNINECVWSATEYDFNTQHIIVISYENIGDADALNQVAKLWIDPATSTQPAVTTLSQNSPTTSVSRDHIDRIKILQASSSSTPLTIIDEIRVANNWGQALGGAATMGITSVKTSELKMYPNPVSNGKLYISTGSNLEKEVVIFNTLGQQVLQAKTVTEAINVTNLNKGTYFVKITEAGITAAKKLIIQ